MVNDNLKSQICSSLDVFSRAVKREGHILTEHPDLLWQQLYNQLKWEDDFIVSHVEEEKSRRMNFFFSQSQVNNGVVIGTVERENCSGFNRWKRVYRVITRLTMRFSRK